MKVNIVTTIIAVCLSALIGYAFYEYSAEEVKIMIAIGSFICLLLTSVFAMGLQVKEGTATNMRILATLSFIALLISNVICAVTVASQPAYIITNSIILLVCVLLLYLIGKAKQ